MKIDRIKMFNFGMARNVELSLTEPILLIGAHNAQGKSFTIKGIRSALAGEFSGVLKKEYSMLVSHGETKGIAAIETDLGKHVLKVPSGITESPIDMPIFSEYCSDTDLFLSLKKDKQKELLFSLMGVSSDSDDIKERLLKKGFSEDKVKSLKFSNIQGAFDGTKDELSKIRGEWKGVTGESYGKEKAEEYEPEKFYFDEKVLNKKLSELPLLKANCETAIRENTLIKTSSAPPNFTELKLYSETLPTSKKLFESKTKALEAQSKSLKDASDALKSATESVLSSQPLTCVKCGEKHMLLGNRLIPRGEENNCIPPEKIKEYEESLNVATNSFNRTKKELGDLSVSVQKGEAAVAALAAIGDVSKASDEEISQSDEMLSLKRTAVEECEKSIRELQEIKRKALSSIDKKSRADQLHQDFCEWSSISEALSSDGIQRDLLNEAIKPINERLSAHYALIKSGKNPVKWPLIQFDDEINITVSGDGYGDNTPLSLLDRYGSDLWKVGVMVSECISHFSSMKYLLIDRADVLNVKDRGVFFNFIGHLAKTKSLDSAVIACTMKERMPASPPGMNFIWIEEGVYKDG